MGSNLAKNKQTAFEKNHDYYKLRLLVCKTTVKGQQ